MLRSSMDSPTIIHLLNICDNGMSDETQLHWTLCLIITDGSHRHLAMSINRSCKVVTNDGS